MCNTARFWYDGVIDSPLWRSEVITSPVMIHVFSNCSDIIHAENTPHLFNAHAASSCGSLVDEAANPVFTLNVCNLIDKVHRCINMAAQVSNLDSSPSMAIHRPLIRAGSC